MMDSRLTAPRLAGLLGGWRSEQPAYEAIADGIRVLCLDNRVAAGTGLPAERELAARLAVSRTTVAAAYRSLRDSGHIASVRGSGSVVLAPHRSGTGIVAPHAESVDLQQASPPAWPGLAGVMSEAAARSASLVARSGYDMVGREDLRTVIAAHLSTRGLDTTPDQIVVTNGAQSAISLLAAAMVAPGDRVLIETPTYPHAAEALRRRNARLVGIPVDPWRGWDLERAEQAFGRTVPSAAYLMPDFQNPTGASMSSDARRRIAEAAAGVGAIIIVDETTAELDIDRPEAPRPFAALEAEVPGLRTVTLGSLGKTVWGGLRLGWVRADPEIIRRLLAVRPSIDLGTPEFEQAVGALLLPRMPEILAHRAAFLGEGRAALRRALEREVPEWEVPDVHGGVALWVGLGSASSTQLVLAARTHGVLLSSGPRFAVDGGHERHLRIPFTAPADQLTRAVEVCARVWRDSAAAAPPRPVDALV